MGEEAATSSKAPEEATMRVGERADEAEPLLAIGASLGRYLVLERIGRGAMGQVLRAYDPKLQREVALKVVSSGAVDPATKVRMLREARAMAQLSHANVVAVFDAEESQLGIVVVMEYVAGQTLGRWVRAPRASWSEIVAHFVDAGRGLAAAHAAGLLHRDFKPSNVLVADSGAVKVTDFGLAKLTSVVSPDASSDSESDRPKGLPPFAPLMAAEDESALTRAGTVVGTPRYMSPEQHDGQPLGPATDQYSFCAALWEGLCGAPPFQVKGVAALREAKRAGAPVWPSERFVPPARVQDAVRRGLEVHPEDRWPSMEALLDALAYDPARRRMRWLSAAAGVSVIAAAIVSWRASTEATGHQCTGARDQLVGIWDVERREQSQAAVLGIAAAFAKPVWDRTVAELDQYADRWVAMHTEACEATTRRGDQSVAVMDLRMACLHRARVRLDAVTEVLLTADADVVRNAHDVVGGLLPLSRCADIEALRSGGVPPSPDEAAAVNEIRALVSQAGAQREAGRFTHARTAITRAKKRLESVAYEPVRAEVALEEGVVLERLGEYEASELALREAMKYAARGGLLDTIQDAATSLMLVVGDRRSRMPEALQLRELALGLAASDPVREALARNNVAIVLSGQGHLEEATAEFRTALGLRENALGPAHPLVASTRSNLAVAMNAEGHHADAEAQLRQAIADTAQALGPEHPSAGSLHNNLGIALHRQRKLAAAEAEYRRALEICDTALGVNHPLTATWRSNLSNALLAGGHYEEAEAEQRRVAELMDETLGPEHPNSAQARSSLANALSMQGFYEEASTQHRRATEQLLATLGPEHPITARAISNLATNLLGAGNLDEAETEQRRALKLREKALAPGHPDIAGSRVLLAQVLHAQGRYEDAVVELRLALAMQETAHGLEGPIASATRTGLADALLELGEVDEALEVAESAWGYFESGPSPAQARPLAAFVLARALAAQSGHSRPRRAELLAHEALDGYASSPGDSTSQIERVEKWLREGVANPTRSARPR